MRLRVEVPFCLSDVLIFSLQIRINKVKSKGRLQIRTPLVLALAKQKAKQLNINQVTIIQTPFLWP